MWCRRLDKHQQCGDDPQKVEDSAEHRQLLLRLSEIDSVAARFQSFQSLFLTWNDHGNEQNPRDDRQKNRDVETTLGTEYAQVGEEDCDTCNGNDCGDRAVLAGETVQSGCSAECFGVTVFGLHHLALVCRHSDHYWAHQQDCSQNVNCDK